MVMDRNMLLSNGLKSITYLHEAFGTGDFETARLEVQEILYVIELLEEYQVKEERKAMLEELIINLQHKGVNVEVVKKVIS